MVSSMGPTQADRVIEGGQRALSPVALVAITRGSRARRLRGTSQGGALVSVRDPREGTYSEPAATIHLGGSRTRVRGIDDRPVRGARTTRVGSCRRGHAIAGVRWSEPPSRQVYAPTRGLGLSLWTSPCRSCPALHVDVTRRNVVVMVCAVSVRRPVVAEAREVAEAPSPRHRSDARACTSAIPAWSGRGGADGAVAAPRRLQRVQHTPPPAAERGPPRPTLGWCGRVLLCRAYVLGRSTTGRERAGRPPRRGALHALAVRPGV